MITSPAPDAAAAAMAPLKMGGQSVVHLVYGGFEQRKIVSAPAAAAAKAAALPASRATELAPRAREPDRDAIVTVSPRSARRSASGLPICPAPMTRWSGTDVSFVARAHQPGYSVLKSSC
jgi:hypothetical protein